MSEGKGGYGALSSALMELVIAYGEAVIGDFQLVRANPFLGYVLDRLDPRNSVEPTLLEFAVLVRFARLEIAQYKKEG